MSKFNLAKRKIILILTTFVCLSFTTQLYANLIAELSDGDTLTMKGIGMHKELRNDIYLGALFGPESVTNVELLIGDNVAKRMSIRFISNYSARKMARHWKERLAMNNSRSKWQPLTKDIVLFSRIFKRNFQVGDEINIDHVPGVGTQVTLNGTLFKTIKTVGFADLLLNVWLGTNPPTKAFKFAIRGENKTTLASYSDSYSNLQIDKGRFDADLIDITKVASVTKTKVNTQDTKPKTKKTESNITKDIIKVASLPKVNLPVQEKLVPAKVNPLADNKTVKKTTEQPQPKTEANTKVATDKVATMDLKIEKPELELKSSLIGSHKVTSQSNEKVAIASKSGSPATTITESEEDFFDADLISGSYIRDLINAVRKHEKYPKKAYIRGEQGTVGARVTIGSKGEVISVDIIERSGSRILDRSVIKMVKKAAPFEMIPKELKLEKFEFDLPITFQL
jgi:periplasmic protein TonB